VNERVAFIDKVIKNAGPVELIVIDGVAELCTNYNDEKASAEAIQHLMRWSDMTGAMVITILHTTKMHGYAKGHLGSILEKIYDFGWTVSKDPETHVFSIKCRDSRFAPFPSVEFERGLDGRIVQDDAPTPEPESAHVYSSTDITPKYDGDIIPF
jgi:hypothetical protein